MESIIEFLFEIDSYVWILPLLIGLVRIRKLGRSQRMLLLWISIAAIFEIVSWVMMKEDNNNLPLYHLYTVLEFGFLLMIFFLEDKKIISVKQLIIAISFFSLFGIINVLFLQKSSEFSSYTRTIEGIILIVISLRYFGFIFNEGRKEKLEKSFIFWFASAILLFFSVNLLLFLSSNFLGETSIGLLRNIYLIHTILIIILYVIFAIGLLCSVNQRSAI